MDELIEGKRNETTSVIQIFDGSRLPFFKKKIIELDGILHTSWTMDTKLDTVAQVKCD